MVGITNGTLTIQVKEHGAELSSLRCDGREYLWQADPAYWKRHSPVLFPIVGSVWDGKYRSGGRTFEMGQHGFARDMDFVLIDDQPDAEGHPQVLFALRSNDETLKKYPYRFRLEIGYRLIGRSVEVIWRVQNPSPDQALSFQIGAHPAFHWPLLTNEEIEAGVAAMDAHLAQSQERGSFRFDTQASTLTKSVITEKGCVDPKAQAEVALQADGVLSLDTTTFNQDALVIEHDQIHRVTLCDQAGNPYLTVSFEAPLVGLWSPPGKNAPFVCIEPWYGRCDRVHYAGVYEAKDWIQTLDPFQTFEARYQITVE